jgi:L-lactate permease
MKGGAMKYSTNPLFVVPVLIATMILVFDQPSFSATSSEKETLRGVGSLNVLVTTRIDDKGAKGLGITNGQLQADAEETLTKAGIKVAKNVSPYLLVSLSIISISHPTVNGILAYVYTAQIKFRQGAVIDSTGTRASVTTWDETRYGASTPTKNMNAQIRASVSTLVAEFAKDYQTANQQ